MTLCGCGDVKIQELPTYITFLQQKKKNNYGVHIKQKAKKEEEKKR